MLILTRIVLYFYRLGEAKRCHTLAAGGARRIEEECKQGHAAASRQKRRR